MAANETPTRDDPRSHGPGSSAGDLTREIRFAWRALRRTPGFTAAAVASLALGLALTATTVAVVNAYLLRAMPYPFAERLYHVSYNGPGQPEPRGLSSLDWSSLRDVVEIADSSAPTRLYLVDGDYTQDVNALRAAWGALEALAVRVTSGRTLRAGDFAPGAEPVALISEGLWRDRFGGDPQIVGRQFRANILDQGGPTTTFRIVGVLPPDFHYARDYGRGAMDLVLPLRSSRGSYMVRLRPTVPLPHAVRRITEAVRSVSPTVPADWTAQLESVHTRYVGSVRPVLVAITVAAGLVLLIVSANVAVLVLLRAMRRQHEIAVRVALGAGRRQIVRLLVAESGLVCTLAMVTGLALTGLTLRVLAPLIEERLGRPVPGGATSMAVDPTVLLIVGGIGALIALSLSCVPLLAPWQHRLAETLRRQTRGGTDGPAMRRVRSSLIIAEVAASLALLVGCGLMIRSVVHLVGTNLGFETDGVTRARIALPERTYADAAAFLRFYDRLSEQLASRPRVRFALSTLPSFFELPKQSIEVEGRAVEPRAAGMVAVSDGYFATLGIGIRRGRGIEAGDRPGTEPVAVVSESFARRLWPDGSAVGRRIRTGEQPRSNAPLGTWRTIVGVVGDVRHSFTDQDLSDVYLPFAQAPARYAPLYVRAADDASGSLAGLRAMGASIDPEVLIGASPPLSFEAAKQLAGPRFLMATLTGLATFAALLALIGIYGVVAYAVHQREREIAIRIAIGATHGSVIVLFLREGGLVLLAGIGCGLLGATAVARILANQLYGVRPFDAWTLLAASLLMVVGGVLAIWWPARRAANISPVTILNAS